MNNEIGYLAEELFKQSVLRVARFLLTAIVKCKNNNNKTAELKKALLIPRLEGL